jgi:hypothetical protein
LRILLPIMIPITGIITKNGIIAIQIHILLPPFLSRSLYLFLNALPTESW